MRLISQIPIANATANIKLPSGSYQDFMIHVSGTNGAVAATLADMGNVRLTFRGDQKQFINLDRLSAYNNLKNGALLFNSVAAGALDAVVFLPQAIPGDLMNVLFIDSGSNAYLQLNYTALSALAGITGTVTIYGLERDGIQKYFHILTNYDVTLGAGTQRERMPFKNIYEVLIENDAVLDRLHVFKDEKTVVDSTKVALQAVTNWENKIEVYSSSLGYIDVELAKTKQLDESLSDDVSVEYNLNAAGTLNNVVSALQFSEQQLTVSEVQRNTSINMKLQRKTVSGDAGALRVLGRYATGKALA